MEMFDYVPFFSTFTFLLDKTMTADKQERSVVHLELNAEHYYFGSVKALCDNFGKEQIGIGYKSLANYGVAPDKPYRNKYCTIRKGILITAPKTEQQ